MKRLLSSSAIFVAGLLCFRAEAAEWPQFRGPGARGVSDGAGLPKRWSATENVAWKADIPGLGWSSPIVSGSRVFVTTALQEGPAEEPELGFYLGKSRAGSGLHWLLLCLDLENGRLLWKQEARAGDGTAIHLKNSHASATPVTDGESVYAWFGAAGLFAFDAATGKPLWNAPVGGQRTRHDWGGGASPVLHGDRIYLVNDNEEDAFVAAFDRKSGQELWRKKRPSETNWSTPFIWESGKRTELIVPATERTISYDLEGNELWSLRGASSITIPTPFSAHGLLYVASGYFGDTLKPLYAIRPGASGDITPAKEETSTPHIAWLDRRAAPYNPSPLVYRDQLYVLLDQGFLASYDAVTGRESYGKQRLNAGGIANFTASPWASDGHIYCLSERGVTFVVEAGPQFKVIGTNDLGEPCLATPALAGDRLLIRTAGNLYCIREAKN
jgi:outer membrane protein assembly factor BamB